MKRARLPIDGDTRKEVCEDPYSVAQGELFLPSNVRNAGIVLLCLGW